MVLQVTKTEIAIITRIVEALIGVVILRDYHSSPRSKNGSHTYNSNNNADQVPC